MASQIAVNKVHLFVLGIHGDSQVVAWSKARIGEEFMDDILPADKSAINRNELEIKCKHRSQQIVQPKCSAPFGIGSTLASICSSILLNKCDVNTVSHFQARFSCFLSMPAILGRDGISRTFDMTLNEAEETAIDESVKGLKELAYQVSACSEVRDIGGSRN
jgi:L-lactate dehydrogenase